MEFLTINGAHGEGGGQVVRTAATLSCITNKPVKIKDIRKNRKTPGLKAQHVAGIKMLAEVCNAKVDGVVLGSSEVSFVPGDVNNYRVERDIGTAGSVCLALQSIIPVVLGSKKRLEVRITGGTDVSWSPTFDYLSNVIRNAFGRVGLDFEVRADRRGYYPRGGGDVTLHAKASDVSPFNLTERKTSAVEIRCSYSKIAEETIRNRVDEVVRIVRKGRHTVTSQIRNEDASDAGAALLVYMSDEKSVIGAGSLFNSKISDFELKLDAFVDNVLGVDENLADMLVVPASIIPGMSVFRVPRITRHLETNLFVASKITGCRYGIGKTVGGFEVRVEGVSYSSIH